MNLLLIKVYNKKDNYLIDKKLKTQRDIQKNKNYKKFKKNNYKNKKTKSKNN